MIFNLKASYLEYMYKTVGDSVNSDLLKRSRSQIKVKRFGFSEAVFIFIIILQWDLKQEVLCLCTHYTAHTKKSRPLWSVMKDDSAPTQKRRKLVKIYKNVLP